MIANIVPYCKTFAMRNKFVKAAETAENAYFGRRPSILGKSFFIFFIYFPFTWIAGLLIDLKAYTIINDSSWSSCFLWEWCSVEQKVVLDYGRVFNNSHWNGVGKDCEYYKEFNRVEIVFIVIFHLLANVCAVTLTTLYILTIAGKFSGKLPRNLCLIFSILQVRHFFCYGCFLF